MSTTTSPHLSKALSSKLPAPKSQSDRDELGLEENLDEFALNDLEADLLMILVYDMYCHVCHQSADNMQWLADKLNNDLPSRKVKVIGLGRGDTEFEVQTFKKKLKLRFVGISDREKTVTDALGTRRTPSGYLLCKKSGKYRVLNSFEGYLSKAKAKEFLSVLGVDKAD